MNDHRLRVLIVEDDPSKKQRLFQHLQSMESVMHEPEVCICAADAVRRMQDTQYDLLLLDVVIPARSGGNPSEENSLELLQRIDEAFGGIRPPKYVLAMSSVSGLSGDTLAFFRHRPWGIVPYSEESLQALNDVESIANWIFSQQSRGSPDIGCDIFIITALEDPEFTAVEQAFPGLGPLQPLDSKQLVRFGDFKSGNQTYRLGAGFCGRMGPVASALLASKIIEQLKPKLILMAGICAGISDKVELGDVVAADPSWDWQSGKFVDRDGAAGFQIAPHQLGLSQSSRTQLTQLKRDDSFWTGFLAESRALKLSTPKLVVGPMATGASVLADARVTARIKDEQHKNVVAVDMETYAIYAASEAASVPVEALSLKAVCDKGDSRKDDRYQQYASRISAELVRHFLEKFAHTYLTADR